jgi:hypothetical protein
MQKGSGGRQNCWYKKSGETGLLSWQGVWKVDASMWYIGKKKKITEELDFDGQSFNPNVGVYVGARVF